MDVDLILKLALMVVVLGISIKLVKFLSGFIFKIALILTIILIAYKMFIGL